MTWFEFTARVLSVYAVTIVLTASHIMKGFRRIFRRMAYDILPWCIAKHLTQWENFNVRAEGQEPEQHRAVILEDREDLDLSTERLIHGYDFISCRLCAGLWMTPALCAWNSPPAYLLAIFGASYFLATQERE